MARSPFPETKYMRDIHFTNLPEKCIIKIYTINGEMVNTIKHENTEGDESGTAKWNMRTVNNQEISPGLYIYTVEAKDNSGNDIKHIGKFAVIR